MGRTARLAAASPRVGFTALSPGGIHRSVTGWDPPLCPPGGIHRSVPRVGFTARPAAAGPSPPRWSLPVPGWTIPFGPPDGPHRPLVAAGPRLGYTARSPDGPHRPLVAAGPRLGYTTRSPGWAAPPGWPLPVPEWAAPPAGRCRSPVGL